MSNELIINASLPETRIALMENGEIQELLIERASGKGIVGNIYKGRVTRVLPGMQAAFVDIGLEKAAFLYVDDVYVHSEVWEDEEDGDEQDGEVVKKPIQVISPVSSQGLASSLSSPVPTPLEGEQTPGSESQSEEAEVQGPSDRTEGSTWEAPSIEDQEGQWSKSSISESDELEDDFDDEGLAISGLDPEEDDDSEGSGNPVKMDADPKDSDQGGDESSEDGESSEGKGAGDLPEGTIAPEGSGEDSDPEATPGAPRKRHKRGRRGGRFRRKGSAQEPLAPKVAQESYPENYHEQVADPGNPASDRSGISTEATTAGADEQGPEAGRPEEMPRSAVAERRVVSPVGDRPEFKAPRARDRRIKQKTIARPVRSQVNIQDLLKEGQEVLVQVAKDPIATKGARLTCHISLPGRHLVCMPTIDHVGVSRRIERDEERRRLREYVERNRPRNLGFIVRTASGKQQSEKRIKQDIEYLTRLWTEIREKAATLTAPSLVYEDLNSVLRAVRDWVTEEIDKVIVDSRYHYNDVLRFVSHFMPSLKNKIELYHGDIPIFDAYGISTELSRALERKVWLKSGGYIVVDQAEALVAIDVNTGRYVGKKNLEDTILKTNLEAVQEIAYQLRLRNCGGIIILDLIDMEKEENKQRVYRALEEALMRDRARPSILKISELGLIEMTRKRTRDTIVRTLCDSCTHCEGKGFIKGKLTVAYEAMREIERAGIERDVSKILVQAHPDVIDILAIDERETLDQLERRYRKQVYLQAVTDFHPEQFEVTADKGERTEKSQPSESGGDRSRGRNADRGRDRGRDREKDRERDKDRDSSRASGQTTGVITPVIISPVLVPIPVVSPVVAVAIPVPLPVSEGQGVSSSQASQDGSFDEEDRLAFLRAQAAQDAALARLGNGNAHAPAGRTPTDHSNRGDRSDRGGMNNRGGRGRRGGKFKRGPERNRDRGGQKAYSPQPTVKGPREVVANTTESRSATSTSGSGENTGGGSGNGGDQSQPPV